VDHCSQVEFRIHCGIFNINLRMLLLVEVQFGIFVLLIASNKNTQRNE